MSEIGLESPRSLIALSMEEAWTAQAELGFPIVIRPSFTMGGTGGGIAYNREEFETIVARGLMPRQPAKCCSKSRWWAGKNTRWRSCAIATDNCIIICSIENLDAMGVHTG